MSIELRIGHCLHDVECNWGVINNGEADPRRELEHLMLVTGDYIRELLQSGPIPGPHGGVHSATTQGSRIFAHLDYNGRRTTWELFDAHFDDGQGPDDILIGRWPD